MGSTWRHFPKGVVEGTDERPERRIVELACLAPSIHNTQPWKWRIADGVIELHADRARQLPVADPDGRSLAISCGAALHHATVAAIASGYRPTVERHGAPGSDVLAVIGLTEAPTPATAADDLALLRQRVTDRRRFTSWPIPDGRLRALAATVGGNGFEAVALTDEPQRARIEQLVDRAMRTQDQVESFQVEQASWIDRPTPDGIPTPSLAPRENGFNARRSRFGVHLPPSRPPASERIESSDGLIVLTTDEDTQPAWLACGEALSAIWLSATRAGQSLVPLSQVIEVPETREALRHELVGRRPQLLVRVGWQEMCRSTLPHTPRRPVDDVLIG